MQKEAMDELKNLHNPETSDTSFDHVLKYTGIFGGVQGLKMSVSVVREKLTGERRVSCSRTEQRSR